MRSIGKDILRLGIGSFLFVFVSWKWNVALAAWLCPVFLLSFVRNRRTWHAALWAYPPLALASFVKFTGTWGALIGVGTEAAVSAAIPLPLVVALLIDRFFYRKAPEAIATLIFPSAYVVLDYAFSRIPGIQSGGSISVSQFSVAPVVQVAAVAGIWGISFLVTWLASAICAWWDRGFPIGRGEAAPIKAALVIACGVFIAGGIRLTVFAPASETVKIAGIAVGQQADYWDEILEKGVPEEEAAGYRGDFARLEATLMQKSEQAAMAGAKIVFWSESNLFAYENDLPGLLARAQDFAREHRIYFAPSIQVLRFGSTVNDSRSVMIRPDGEIAYTNKKHVSWYRTDSDGIIRYVDTPYGRIGSAICFDMDSPGYIRQAGANSVDIMLVPAYDTEGGSPYHTYVGLLRGPENGFSVFRSVSHGTSIAIDYEGNARAEQDYFSSPDGILFADLPTKGARTPYAASGDWLAYASFLFLLAILVSRMAPARRRSDSHA